MKKEIIICVDDEQIVLNALNTQLKNKFGDRYGYEFAESGEEALDIVDDTTRRGNKVVMIISDQLMPGMTGDQFLIHMHQKHPRPIKVLLTGQAGLESAINAINHANLYRYMLKPWDQEDFLLTIEKGLQEYYLVDELEQQCENLKQLNEANSRFVPMEFIETLGKTSITEVRLGDQIEGEMTVFFSDIRSYTTLSEGMSPKENFDFINGYLSRIEPFIEEHRGFVNQFLGDGIMAIFPKSARDAIESAIDIQKALMVYNEERRQTGRVPVQIGIGLHTGYLMMGIIGAKGRLAAGIISDTVNTASRMEGLTKQFGARIVISQTTLAGLSDPAQFKIRFLGKVQVKGKNEPLAIYEVFDGDSDEEIALKKQTLADFSTGLQAYFAKDFAMTIVHFKNVLKANPTDKTAQRYLELAAKLVVSGVPDDWAGVERLDVK